ncbi:hypothetical protein CHELA40_50843 [Chelatococcus asaccharovorans]|nr:hypothetical protein CHELA17_20808 [Chelatococcus asaccharovorans]CAH1694509.1 hypothetical protein CHELA40_50843 [Chelatococcus asaccharovorans]
MTCVFPTPVMDGAVRVFRLPVRPSSLICRMRLRGVHISLALFHSAVIFDEIVARAKIGC